MTASTYRLELRLLDIARMHFAHIVPGFLSLRSPFPSCIPNSYMIHLFNSSYLENLDYARTEPFYPHFLPFYSEGSIFWETRPFTTIERSRSVQS